MLKLENSIRGLSFSRVAFDLTIQVQKNNVGSDTVVCHPNIYYRAIILAILKGVPKGTPFFAF